MAVGYPAAGRARGEPERELWKAVGTRAGRGGV